MTKYKKKKQINKIRSRKNKKQKVSSRKLTLIINKKNNKKKIRMNSNKFNLKTRSKNSKYLISSLTKENKTIFLTTLNKEKINITKF